MSPHRVRIKICGLTDAAAAAACVDAGADAVGLVFFPKSPRDVSPDTAASVCKAVSGRAHAVGVFVNETEKRILDISRRCGLDAVQLHGDEPPEMVENLRANGLFVIKALFYPGLSPKRIDLYRPSAFLVECKGGVLPGGNAETWDWSVVTQFRFPAPVFLAGGLSPGNVANAVDLARPDGVDVSSGVESSPGIKDLSKVADFIRTVRNLPMTREA